MDLDLVVVPKKEREVGVRVEDWAGANPEVVPTPAMAVKRSEDFMVEMDTIYPIKMNANPA